MRKILLMILAGTACLLNSCGQKVSNVLPITVFPDSIISDCLLYTSDAADD